VKLTTKLSSVRVNSSQSLSFPVSIAAPDDDEFIIQSNPFTYNGSTCTIKNKLSSNVLQIIAIAGNRVIIDNTGSYDPSSGVVTINYFNPSNIAAGLTEIKLSAVPSNPSAIAPERNELLVFDPDRSTSQAVTVAAIN
jgi:hypothetical protein